VRCRSRFRAPSGSRVGNHIAPPASLSSLWPTFGYSIIASWTNKLLAASHRHGRLSRFRVGFKVKDASSQSLESSKASGQTALSEGRVGVDHWIPPPLRARTDGLVSLKQLSDVRLLHPLMLRQTLNLVQHPCVHPVISALGSDTVAAVHAELQDWKSSLQTRTLWLPALQGDLAGLSD
jgi:hypothetical protein